MRCGVPLPSERSLPLSSSRRIVYDVTCEPAFDELWSAHSLRIAPNIAGQLDRLASLNVR